MTDLPDVNVWVALTAQDHPHHQRAAQYWNTEAAPRIAFCPPTMMGLMRVLTSPHVLGGAPLTVEDAWQTYRHWRRDRAVVYEPEPARCQLSLDRLIVEGNVQPRTWSDAYLAAFAESAGLRLVSFDSDFQRFKRLALMHLRE